MPPPVRWLGFEVFKGEIAVAIVTISRGSYSRGREVAEKVAQMLAYRCTSRDVLIEASKEFNVPEVKLIRAIHDAPSILERFTGGKKKYVAFMQAARLEQLCEDNVVYHGLGAPFFLKGVSHVLKVRIIAEMEDRVKLEMEREGIPRRTALQILKADDEERRKWSRHLYGIDTADPSLYDMLIHIKKITVDDAADLICRTIQLEHFRTTPESQQVMDNLALAMKVKAALVDVSAARDISADKGAIRIKVAGAAHDERRQIESITEEVAGVREVQIDA